MSTIFLGVFLVLGELWEARPINPQTPYLAGPLFFGVGWFLLTGFALYFLVFLLHGTCLSREG